MIKKSSGVRSNIFEDLIQQSTGDSPIKFAENKPQNRADPNITRINKAIKINPVNAKTDQAAGLLLIDHLEDIIN